MHTRLTLKSSIAWLLSLVFSLSLAAQGFWEGVPGSNMYAGSTYPLSFESMVSDTTGHLLVCPNNGPNQNTGYQVFLYDGTTFTGMNIPDIASLKVKLFGPFADGNVYAMGSNADENLMKWDGYTWTNTGISLNTSTTRDLVVHADGTIYRASNFDVFRYNDGNWIKLGGGFDNNINDITLDAAGNLYATGWFTLQYNPTPANTISLPYIAKWDGLQWVNIGNIGQLGTVVKVSPEGHIYVGGFNNLKISTNQTTWVTQSGVSGWVQDILFDTSGTYITGEYFLKKKVGATYTSMIGGLNGPPSNVEMLNGVLYTTGSFGSPARLARWNPVYIPPVLSLSYTAQPCFGCPASISATVNGGAPPLNYKINDEPFVQSNTGYNFDLGAVSIPTTYTIIVGDALFNQDTLQASITPQCPTPNKPTVANISSTTASVYMSVPCTGKNRLAKTT